jgi:hypothetical protein
MEEEMSFAMRCFNYGYKAYDLSLLLPDTPEEIKEKVRSVNQFNNRYKRGNVKFTNSSLTSKKGTP